MARYRAKKKAEKLIEGDYAAQYNKLWNYCREVKRANPRSNVFMTVTEDDEGEDRFERLYMCFSACKKGFLAGCRPIIGLDGCHLRDAHKGVILAAVGLTQMISYILLHLLWLKLKISLLGSGF
mgnify:CR=1 FL=1